MARGFINLNRFKHGRAIKRNSKQKDDRRGGKRLKGSMVDRYRER